MTLILFRPKSSDAESITSDITAINRKSFPNLEDKFNGPDQVSLNRNRIFRYVWIFLYSRPASKVSNVFLQACLAAWKARPPVLTSMLFKPWIQFTFYFQVALWSSSQAVTFQTT